jgi:hypothetical protein
MKRTYQYSLRFAIDPYNWDDLKEAKLIKFCKEAQIDNVVFFINPEELNQGHPTLEQIRKHWLPTIQKVAQKLAQDGISMSLNPWTSLMHSDRGYSVPPELGFKTMVDYLGHHSTSIACPKDLKWVDYIAKVYAEYAKLQPKELWIEDDFRHYNHTPIKLACFCDHHMAIYSEMLKRPITREEFVQKMLQPGEPTTERIVYLGVARAEMKQAAEAIQKAVAKVAPQTRVGLMSSFPEWHAVEGRDWDGLFDKLSGEHRRVSRPHLPAYNEVAPLQYARVFERFTRVTTELVGHHSDVYPELESYMYSPFVKSKAFTKLQLESTQMVGATGILLNLFDMMGNGIDETYDYAQLLADSKALMNFGAQHRLDVTQIDGVKVLFSPDAAFNIKTANGVDPAELLPKEFSWLSLLGTLGIACKPEKWSLKCHFSGETIAISGQFLNNLDDEQIKELLQNNVVLLDGESAQILFERSQLRKLIGASSLEFKPARTGYQSYEQLDGFTFDGIENPRVTMLQHTGDYYQIGYDPTANVQVLSNAYSAKAEKLGPVMTVVNGRTVILPMNTDPKYGWESQYYSIKEQLLKYILNQTTNLDYVIDMPGTKLVATADQMVLSNFTIDDQAQIKIHLTPEKQAQTWQLHFHSGAQMETLQVQPEWIKDDVLTIPHPIRGLETVILLALV